MPLRDLVREHNINLYDETTLKDAGFGRIHGTMLNRDIRVYRPGDIMTKRHCYLMMRQLGSWVYKIKL